jgi:MFS family permease
MVTLEQSRQGRNSYRREMNATRFIVSTLGILFAISGMNHGVFEALQGNVPTTGFFVDSIGVRNQMWAYGTEDAFTLIPNFLVTGIAAIAVSLLIIAWSIGFLHKRHGALVFFLLFVVLLLVGGGVAQVIFFTLASLVATRINRPLKWLRKLLPENVRGQIGKQWPWLLTVFTLLGLAALEIAIVGCIPGVRDPKQVLYFCWSILGLGLMFLLLAIISGFIHDVDRDSVSQ